MPRETTNAGKLGRLQRFSTAMAANSADLPHLEVSRTELDTNLAQAQEAAKQQAAFRASKQEASQRLRTFLTETERVANVLRVAIIQRYDIRSEKLAEFGLQPFRGRNRKAKPEPEQPQTTPQAPTGAAETPATPSDPSPR